MACINQSILSASPFPPPLIWSTILISSCDLKTPLLFITQFSPSTRDKDAILHSPRQQVVRWQKKYFFWTVDFSPPPHPHPLAIFWRWMMEKKVRESVRCENPLLHFSLYSFHYIHENPQSVFTFKKGKGWGPWLARAQHIYSTVVLPVFVFAHCKEIYRTENKGRNWWLYTGSEASRRFSGQWP